jgi:murein DD-endopeptidase MepM/ murein hydrolase activator NlpD
MHRGVDFSARMGTPVSSTADGVVTYSGVERTYGNVDLASFAKFIS